MQKLRYKLRYLWRVIWRGLGMCERCGEWLNYTRSGKGICPKCGR